jgi:hypothetical protein
MMLFVPLLRVQTAVARLPSADSPICGARVLPPVEDRSATVPQVAVLPLTVAEAVWMMKLLPLERVQTAVAWLPSADSPICGDKALCPVADRSATGPQVAVLTLIVAEAV